MAKAVNGWLGMSLVQAARAHRLRVAAGLTKLGLHIGQDLLLMQVWGADGVPQSELVKRLGVERPTITKMLARMQRAGLVRRHRDAHDARVWLIAATPKGEALRAPVEALWADVEGALVRGMSRAGKDAVGAALLRMRDNL